MGEDPRDSRYFRQDQGSIYHRPADREAQQREDRALDLSRLTADLGLRCHGGSGCHAYPLKDNAMSAIDDWWSLQGAYPGSDVDCCWRKISLCGVSLVGPIAFAGVFIQNDIFGVLSTLSW